MSQKIWVIKDIPDKQAAKVRTSQKSSALLHEKNTKQKNPLLAYSLSNIIWGCGQFYNRQFKLGILFLLSMIIFYVSMGICFIHWKTIQYALESIAIDASATLIILGHFYLSGLIVWHANAWQAYRMCTKNQEHYRKGKKMKMLPPLCSIFMPGWGQVLNGQIKKGFCFQLIGITGLATVPLMLVTYSVWPTLELSQSRFIIEWSFSVSVILSPIVFMAWIFNIFDAARVSMNSIKKESLRTRLRLVMNGLRYRRQLYGWKNTLFPLIMRSILVLLLLVFCAVSYHSVPKSYYQQKIHNIGNRMTEKEMTVLPALINKFMEMCFDSCQ